MSCWSCANDNTILSQKRHLRQASRPLGPHPPWLNSWRNRRASSWSLVPKLCLGTPSGKHCFPSAPQPRNRVSQQRFPNGVWEQGGAPSSEPPGRASPSLGKQLAQPARLLFLLLSHQGPDQDVLRLLVEDVDLQRLPCVLLGQCILPRL